MTGLGHIVYGQVYIQVTIELDYAGTLSPLGYISATRSGLWQQVL